MAQSPWPIAVQPLRAFSFSFSYLPVCSLQVTGFSYRALSLVSGTGPHLQTFSPTHRCIALSGQVGSPSSSSSSRSSSASSPSPRSLRGLSLLLVRRFEVFRLRVADGLLVVSFHAGGRGRRRKRFIRLLKQTNFIGRTIQLTIIQTLFVRMCGRTLPLLISLYSSDSLTNIPRLVSVWWSEDSDDPPEVVDWASSTKVKYKKISGMDSRLSRMGMSLASPLLTTSAGLSGEADDSFNVMTSAFPFCVRVGPCPFLCG